MSRTYRYPNRHDGRCRPRLERLEDRLALSLGEGPISLGVHSAFSVSAFDTTATDELGPNLSVVSTDPVTGTTFASSPTILTVNFDRPLLAVMLGSDDIPIQREDGGQWVPAFDDFSLPTESLDSTGYQLQLTPMTPLTPGHYRMILPSGCMLMGVDGSMIADPGYDQVLSEFTVAQPGVTLADATPLPDVVGTPVQTPGQLDLASDSSAVQLYRVDLPEGHRWRLGCEVSAQNQQSGLLSTLSLFDAQGNLLATSSHGRPGAPDDPYLFSGLQPGTYYIGVSGRGNVPGQPGGYDPAAGIGGEADSSATGGAYSLNVVADPADTPTRLLGFTLNNADPLSASPTGLTLTFSGPLDLATLRGDPCPGISLVGPDGQVVPMTIISYNEPGARFEYVFDHALAPGTYRVCIPQTGGVTDLSGMTPASDNGTLATFTVADRHTARDPNNLGPLFSDVQSGLTFTTQVDPGTAATYRFVVLAEGVYQFDIAGNSNDPVAMRLYGPDGLTTRDATPPSKPGLYLEPGIYSFQLVNEGQAGISLTWMLQQKTRWDSLLDNGVGQGPALDLRLVNPSSAPPSAPAPAVAGPVWSAGSGAGGSGGVVGPISTVPVTGSSPSAPVGTGPVASATTVASGGLWLTLDGEPVGRPTTEAEHISVVGPAVSGGVALASTARGLIQGIGYGQGSLDERQAVTETSPDVDSPAARGDGKANVADAAAVPPVNGAMVPTMAARRDVPDEVVIAAADWLARMGRSAYGMLSAQPEDVADPGGTVEPTQAVAVASTGDDGGELRGVGHVERASIDAPLVVSVAAALAMRYHQPMLHWVRRKRAADPSRRNTRNPLALHGMHLRV